MVEAAEAGRQVAKADYESGNFAISPSGTLVYVPGDDSHFRRTLMTADATVPSADR